MKIYDFSNKNNEFDCFLMKLKYFQIKIYEFSFFLNGNQFLSCCFLTRSVSI